MKAGPQIECQRCTMPILLAFAETDGAGRSLTCIVCGYVHVWTIAARGAESLDDSKTSLGSSVE